MESLRTNSATIKWQPPSMSNGTISFYHVEVQANHYNLPKILELNVNYCTNRMYRTVTKYSTWYYYIGI